WMPAETVPLVGAPATFDWQLPRVPVKLYAKFPEALVRGGLMFATPCSWHAPPLGPAALARDPPRQAIALRAATKRIRERRTPMAGSPFRWWFRAPASSRSAGSTHPRSRT